jgi:hypothetical protein
MILVGERVGDFFPAAGAVGGAINVPGLLATFLSLYFLVATQDIAVDGWALTLLRPENVGYASAANTVGQGVGIQAAFGLFLALDSAEVCNRYIRGPLGLPAAAEGMVSLGSFLRGWGAVFVVATLLVWALQPERERGGDGAGAAAAPPAAPPAAAPAAPPAAPPAASKAPRGGAAADGHTEREERGEAEEEGARLLSGVALGGSGAPRRRHSGREADEKKAPPPLAAPLEAAAPAPPLPPSAAASVASAYVEFFRVLRLPHFILLALVMVTVKAGFSLTDRASGLVMQGRGVPKETLAFVDMVSFPVQLGVQVRHFSSSPKPPRAPLTSGPPPPLPPHL